MTDQPRFPSYSVVIPTFRRVDLLQRAFDAISREAPDADQFIIIYRPKDDPETAAWIEKVALSFPRLTPIPIDRPGKVAALNRALCSATGDIVVMIDDDIVVRYGWLSKILAHFSDEGVGAAGGHDFVHGPQGTATRPALARAGYRNLAGRIVGGHDVVTGPARNVEVLKGCNWAVRRSALGTLEFDERLLGIGAQAGDDYWFCLNIRRAGWRIVLDPAAIVDHFPAYKPDYEQGSWGRVKCYEWTANQTAHNLAFVRRRTKLIYIVHSILVGVRHCPGLYFTFHSLLKRPRSLPGQLIGGWAGFMRGLSMAKDFKRSPPGRAISPATCKTDGNSALTNSG